MGEKKRVLKSILSMILILSMIISSFTSLEAKAKSSDTMPKAVYGGDGFEVTFQVTSQWQGAFNCDVILKNTSNKAIENWALRFEMAHEITNIWNGVVSSSVNGIYVIKNAGFNHDVEPGKSVSFGFGGKWEKEIQLPAAFEILSFEEAVEAGRYEISFNVTSDWKSAFNGEIKIKNISDKTIEDWKLEFDFSCNIDRFWSAVILEHTGDHYKIKNAGYNYSIKPGETVVLGFSATPGNITAEPVNYILNEIVMEQSTVDIEKDTDNDELIDWLEKSIGTDPDNPDTDGDGLSDYIEYISGLNPLVKDTDNNGIEDALEDTDLDGLNNQEEIRYGTDCLKNDTDNDSLMDGEEVNNYKTSPVMEDTDGDTLTDGDEIRLGLNPLTAYSDDITLDSNRKIQQVLSEDRIEDILKADSNLLIPFMNGAVSNVIDKCASVEQSNNEALQENRAILGEPINIESSYTAETDLFLGFDYSNLLTYYTEDHLDTLVICQYADDDFIPLDTSVDKENHSLYTNISGGGTYFVLNIEEFLNSLGINPLEELESYETDSYSTLKEDMTILDVDPNANIVPEEWYEEYYNSTENDISNANSFMASDETFNMVPEESLLDSTKGQADITFVIDTTGSMYSAISNVRNNISQFVDRLTTEYNVQVNFSLIDYKDITADGLDSTRLIKNGTSNWFSNVETYKSNIAGLYITGGGDRPETAIDGLAMANNLDYRSNVNKFVILVTDADYKVNNQYGIASLDKMAEMLKAKNINASVIAPTTYKGLYTTLFETTGGIFADIYGDFSKELLKLADKIGEDVNDGTWVLLSDYQYIKLADEVLPTNYVDTDGDRVSDYNELGTKEEKDLSWYVKTLLKAYAIPEQYYTGKTSVSLYNYVSNPVHTDTDYDGLDDSDSRDLVKRDNGSIDANSFSGRMVGYYESGINIEFKVDYSDFFTMSNTTYHKDLSVLASVYATAAYHGNMNITTGAAGSGEITDIFELYGLDDIRDYSLSSDFTDDDISEVIIGHRLVEYKGEKKDIIVTAVRGTNGTIEEWSSNFDVGADTDGYWDRNNPYWRNKTNHKGFDVTANRIYDYIQSYINNYVNTGAEKVMYIMGHSRGAAVANILGSLYENKSNYETYVYTFATPNNTTNVNASSYKTIFNVVNSDDIIPQLPLKSWGFDKYGKTYSISIAEFYEDSNPFTDKVGTFEWLVGKDYNDDGGTSRTLSAFSKVASNREQIYKYDMSSDGVVNPHNKYHTTLSGANAELVKVNQELKDQGLDKYAYAYVEDGLLKNVLVRYMPAFLMQVLANMTCGVGPTLGFDVNGKYASAKTSFVFSSGKLVVGGMASPHCQESYYLIARNNFQALP